MRTIKILSSGPIRTMGMIHGPILTPYKVDENKLKSLLREGLEIVELLPDKTEKKLTISDMSATSPVKEKKETPVATEPKKEYVAPVVSEENTETADDVNETSEEPVAEEPEKQIPRKNKHKK